MNLLVTIRNRDLKFWRHNKENKGLMNFTLTVFFFTFVHSIQTNRVTRSVTESKGAGMKMQQLHIMRMKKNELLNRYHNEKVL